MKRVFLLLSLQFAVCSLQLSEINAQPQLSGELSYDAKISFNESQRSAMRSNLNIEEQKKSVWLAAGLSALIPGAGQFYNESFIKSALFITLEAAAITVGLIYDKKGNDQTNLFQNYADGTQGWSVLRYAQWTLIHIKDLNPNLNRSDYESKVIQNGKVNWDELHVLETAVAGRDGKDGSVPGSYYSHHLPLYGEQQYYELIGKYPQFAIGWYEFSGTDLNKSFFYGDPLPQQFLDYSKMRGEANDFYNVASKAVIVVIVNHILSAIDAAWSASRYNRDLDLHASIEKFNYGFYTVYYPQLNLKFSF